jgi:hypothetical protein
MKKHYRHENDCLNCGTMLEGKFCHNCGQENLQVKESFGHMMNHAISDYFHFDHQFFHTMKPLLFKPGFLTNEYMAGRRAQYLHPVKMYIFISVMYFLLFFQHTTTQTNNEQHKNLTTTELNQAVKAINQNSFLPAEAKKEAIRDLYRDRGYIMIGNHPVKDTSKKARKIIDEEDSHYFNPSTDDSTYAQYLLSQSKLPNEKQDGWIMRYYNKKAFAVNKQNINIKEVIEETFKHNFPKLMFLLLPLFAFFLSIVFRKNRKFYVEHLIYSFHLHCFLFLFLGIIIIIKMLIPERWEAILGWISILTVVAIIVYFYKSLRAVYQRSRFRTITKMIGISFVYSIAFGVCMALFYIVIAATAV